MRYHFWVDFLASSCDGAFLGFCFRLTWSVHFVVYSQLVFRKQIILITYSCHPTNNSHVCSFTPFAMAEVGDLIDFDAIETQKENIRSIPGGRSAKQLSLLCSPLSSKIPAPLTETQDLRNAARAEFENELLSASESDDPLDIYDRYIKWTLSAYPSASSTTSSGLLPLLERATRAFLHSPLYKNDPRYLKTWLLYIHLFADSRGRRSASAGRHRLERHGLCRG